MLEKEKHMNIYLLERTDDYEGDYDVFIGYVVSAKTLHDAREMCPNRQGKWTCRKIGETDKGSEVFLESFRAG